MSNLKLMSRLNSFSLKSFFCGILLLLLGACSGTYDWRVIQSEQGAFEAMFPSKPNRAERSIQILGENLMMSMDYAKAGNAIFAVSVIKLDSNKSPEQVNEIIAWLKDQTKKTLKVNQPIIEESDLVFTVAANAKEKINSSGVKIVGIGPDDVPRYYWARWIKRVDSTGQLRIYQISVLQSLDKNIDEKITKQLQEEYETFYAGFHPY